MNTSVDCDGGDSYEKLCVPDGDAYLTDQERHLEGLSGEERARIVLAETDDLIFDWEKLPLDRMDDNLVVQLIRDLEDRIGVLKGVCNILKLRMSNEPIEIIRDRTANGLDEVSGME